MRSFLSTFKYFDMPLQIVTGLLILTGLALLYAISLSSQDMSLFYHQLVFVGIGLVGYLAASFYDYHRLAKMNNRIAYPLLIGLLLFVLFFATSIRGSSRWIDFGFFSFQPAEFAKLVIILGLARWMYLRRGQINSWKNIGITIIYTAIPAFLILREPDLGSTIIIVSIWLGILLISPMNKKFLLGLLLAGVVVAGIGWKFFLHDYQKLRIEVFLNPNLDPKGKGYNVKQAVVAVGSGQWAGRGLGQGLQSQLKFLPERHTDFIFASAAEEIGFLGCTVLLVLYGFLFFRLLRIMGESRNDLMLYIVGGVLFMLLGQVIINIGMNIGLLPVTGIPLPFLTYGGSSLLVTLLGLGIVQSVVRQTKSLRF